MVIISGEFDEVVPPDNQENVREFYENYSANVHFESMDIGHTLVYEMPGIVLNHLYMHMEGSGYDTENPVIVSEMDDFSWVENGVLVRFNQWEFITDVEASETNMDEFGWLYYPKSCAAGGCNAGFVLHGCYGRATDMMSFEVGWNSIANNNDIILVFP